MNRENTDVFETEVIGDDEQKEKANLDFYRRLRIKIDDYLREHPKIEFAKYIAAVPDVFYLLIKLAADPAVPPKAKLKLAGAALYFISPIDILPDFVPAVGWLDDLIVGVMLLNRSLNDIDPAVVDKYWLGEDKIYDFIKSVLEKGDQMVGTKIWNKIKKLLNEKA